MQVDTVRKGSFIGVVFLTILCLFFGFMFHWQRGLYMDDYSNLTVVLSPVTGEKTDFWRAYQPTSPIRVFTYWMTFGFTSLIPQKELLVRLISTIGVGANTFLLGFFIYRLLFSKMSAIIGGWLFLMPVFSTEAVLWTGASAYIFSMTTGLLFLHFSLSALINRRFIIPFLLSNFFFIATFLFLENYVALIGLIALIYIIILLKKQSSSRRTLLFRTLFVTAFPTLFVFLMYRLFYLGSEIVSSRGGISFDLSFIAERAGTLAKELLFLTISKSYGGGVLIDAYSVGQRVFYGNALGFIFIILFVFFVGAILFSWQETLKPQPNQYRILGVAFIFGFLWTIISLFFPIVFVKGQGLENRLLYAVFAGFCFIIAVVAETIIRIYPSLLLQRILVGVGACVLFITTITMLGHTEAAARRYQVNTRQVSALTSSVSRENLPKEVVVIPIQLDEQLFDTPMTIDRFYVGVFEVPWSARRALEFAYHRTGILAVTINRWQGVQNELKYNAVRPSELLVHGQAVSIDKALVFTYRNGVALPAESVKLINSSGIQEKIVLPLGVMLKSRGVVTIETIEIK